MAVGNVCADIAFYIHNTWGNCHKCRHVLSHYIATCKIPALLYLQLEPNPGVFYTLISAGSIIDESEGEYIYRMFLRHKLPMFRHEWKKGEGRGA